ncbi:MAG TPA: DUF3376 domain-containing protein [Solirubrobacterales bacterium]|jgi:hypothetical protein|nr:DUF3376 domain-containing protein [Solirubrobacterales bacterium]
MALNGGVSLAVWMGGCAVELDRARRANAPADETPRIYDALCECFGRHLVIDILTGASAGGINGGMLGAAMVSGRKLPTKFVRDQWLDLGDLSDLLYPSTKDDPPALLNGKLFYDGLLATFRTLLGVDAKASGHDECATNAAVTPLVPSLDITMTDVVGVEKRFRDTWGGELVAREHRPRFKFREAAHFNAEALATAARTSASFPIAFEPWPVKGDPRVLAGLPNPTFGIDGGLLDNAPIKAALDLIPSKSANSRVLRYVCYLNGDPVTPSDDMAGGAPDLRAVGGYTINLPRTAPFVDQLYAIKRAVERPRLAERVQLRLLGLDIEELRGVARALFISYQDRRTIESLEELLGDPGAASAMNELLRRTEGHLPWIPLGLESRPTDTWRWGIRPSQRILHLLLDLLRTEIRATTGSLREDLVLARTAIDKELSLLGDARELVIASDYENDPANFIDEAPLDRLQKAVTKALAQAPRARKAVETAAAVFRELVLANPGHFEARPAFRVFYEPPPDDGDWFSTFLQRVLSIEVIRRAFSSEAEIESAEELRFVQLTPAAPSPIFTTRPLSLRSPASASQKLAGVGLGHFAGFYRRSWRANDFMWGRLDAAARIVDLLLDRPSEEVGLLTSSGTSSPPEARSAFLAEALLPEDLPEDAKPSFEARRSLLQEALEDAGAIGDSPPGAKLPADILKPLLRDVIRAELVEASKQESSVNRMPFTRAVFQRAAQLEIVAEDLPVIRDETAKDSKLGSAVVPFPPAGANDEENLMDEIKAVRDLYQEKDGSLPRRLTDSEEVVSDLGLRTITHAAFVALGAVRTAKAPLSKFFGIVRTPLSAVAATVALGRLYRAVAGIGFWAAAVYLTSRLVTANPHGHLEFSAVWSWQALTALVAALAVLGIATVPILRLWRGVESARNFLLAVALLGAAFAFSAALAAIFGEFNLQRIIFTPGASTPPNIVLLAPLVVLGVVSASRLPIPGWLSPLAGAIKAIRTSKFVYLLALATFLLLGIWAGIDLGKESFEGGDFWQACSAVFAFLVAPIVAALSLARWPRQIPARLRRVFGARLRRVFG